LNVAARLAGRSAAGRYGSLARAGLIVTGVALTAAAWIGLFQSRVLEPRGGTIDADPGLAGLAQQLAEWRREGRLGTGNGFHLAPEAANQLAWFCNGEKSFLSSQLCASPAEAGDYVAVRNGLLGRPGADSTNWRDLLRAHHINHVVIYSNNAGEAEQALANLLRMKREWPLLYLGGGAAIFGWRDPLRDRAGDSSASAKRDPFLDLEKNLGSLAYDPRAATLAPLVGPESAPHAFHWWEAFWKRRPYRTPDLREARLAVAAYDALLPAQLSRNIKTWKVVASTSLAIEGARPVGFSLFPATASARRKLFLSGQDDGPPAALYLAIRAARRAIATDPYSARAYFTLGEAYFRLYTTTRERVWADSFPGLGKIRTVQAITAYHEALRLDPDLTDAHDRLAHLFISLEYRDLALRHLREYVRCVRRRGPFPGESADGLDKRLARPERILKNLARNVEVLGERFDLHSANLNVFDRASLAGRMGLAGKALDILLESDVAAFGAEGMDLELKLLLLTGKAENVRLWMSQEHEKVLRAYHWNKIQLHAGLGNYAQADEELQNPIRIRALDRDLTLRTAAGLILGHGILAPTRGGLFASMPNKVFVATGAMPLQIYRLLPDEDEVVSALWTVAEGLNREARLSVLRGLLALESGRIEQAQDRFRQPLVFLKSASSAPFAKEPESASARAIAERFLEVMERSGERASATPSR
jgi:tetratricopeptide (TPR) repeat protein